jgi:hypothetical protein
MDLEIIEFRIGEGVGAYFFADHEEGVSGLALDPELEEPARLAYEAEGLAYNSARPPKGGRKFMLEARDVEDLDRNAIYAIRSVIDDLQPGWVQEVKDACRIANHPRVIADWCELSLAAVVAIIENLQARGEIPEDAGSC